jgi:hypothetical protein
MKNSSFMAQRVKRTFYVVVSTYSREGQSLKSRTLFE